MEKTKIITDDIVANFKKELAELLEKYDASISVTMDDCSDLSGIYGECIEVSFKTHSKRFSYHSVKLKDGFGIDADDLKNGV